MDQENPPQYTSQPIQNSQPVSYEPVQKKSKAPVVLGILLVMALVAAGVFGWLWQQEATKASTAQAGLKSAESKLKAATQVAAVKPDESKTSDETTTSTNKPESDRIINAATTFQMAKTSSAGKTIKAQIDKQNADFASVDVSTTSGMGGAMGLFLKNAEDEWVVIGDSSSDRSLLETQFGLPKDF